MIGDSISDYGNGMFRITHPLLKVQDYVRTQIPSNAAGYCNGRFNDSMNWTEILAYYMLDLDLYNYATGGSSLNEASSYKNKFGSKITDSVLMFANNVFRRRVSSHIHRQVINFKDDYNLIYKDNTLWIMIMAGGNDILYDNTSDNIIAAKVTETVDQILKYLIIQDHQDFKIFVIPSILYICPNLFYMDIDGRSHLSTEYYPSRAHHIFYNSINNLKLSYHSNNLKIEDKVTVIDTYSWNPHFNITKVNKLYNIISQLFQTPLEINKGDYSIHFDFLQDLNNSDSNIIYKVLQGDHSHNITDQIKKQLLDCYKHEHSDNLVCEILTSKIPLSCKSFTKMSNHFEDKHVPRTLTQELAYKLVGIVMFYNRLTLMSEGLNEIPTLKFYDKNMDLVKHIDSMSDGIFERTNCLSTIDIGDGYSFNMREYYSNYDSYHLLSHQHKSIAEYMFNKFKSLKLINNKYSEYYSKLDSDMTCRDNAYFKFKTNKNTSKMIESQVMFIDRLKLNAENYKCMINMKFLLYEYLDEYQEWSKYVDVCNENKQLFKSEKNVGLLTSECVLINDMCLLITNDYYIRYDTNWCSKNFKNMRNEMIKIKERYFLGTSCSDK